MKHNYIPYINIIYVNDKKFLPFICVGCLAFDSECAWDNHFHIYIIVIFQFLANHNQVIRFAKFPATGDIFHRISRSWNLCFVISQVVAHILHEYVILRQFIKLTLRILNKDTSMFANGIWHLQRHISVAIRI